jgi:hypothetical protein
VLETPSALPYPGNVVSARIARHRKAHECQDRQPRPSRSPHTHTLLPK